MKLSREQTAERRLFKGLTKLNRRDLRAVIMDDLSHALGAESDAVKMRASAELRHLLVGEKPLTVVK